MSAQSNLHVLSIVLRHGIISDILPFSAKVLLGGTCHGLRRYVYHEIQKYRKKINRFSLYRELYEFFDGQNFYSSNADRMWSHRSYLPTMYDPEEEGFEPRLHTTKSSSRGKYDRISEHFQNIYPQDPRLTGIMEAKRCKHCQKKWKLHPCSESCTVCPAVTVCTDDRQSDFLKRVQYDFMWELLVVRKQQLGCPLSFTVLDK